MIYGRPGVDFFGFTRKSAATPNTSITDAEIISWARSFRQTRPSPLLGLCARATPAERRQIALALIHGMRPNTREAVLCAGNAVRAIGRQARASFLKTAWQAGPSPPAWATALTLGWIGASSLVIDAAGSRDRLRDWFNHADLANPLPFLRRSLVSRAELPKRLVIYRGGAVSADEMRCGYSWTPHETTAMAYAEIRRLEKDATPIVVKAEVSRSAVSMYTRSGESEVVLIEPPDRIDVVTRPEELRRSLEQLWSSTRAAPNDADVVTLTLDDEDCWCGWTGEPADVR